MSERAPRAASKPSRRRASPRSSSPRTTPENLLLLEQCAAAAGTTADDHLGTLILRDAHARGLLPGSPKPPRASVIAPIDPEWAMELAAYGTPALC